jgi:regulator of protease activity HflC (stomatin/prohibitin superfamily)
MAVVGTAVLAVVIWVLWGFRINVPQDHILVLVRKFGQDLGAGQILATETGQKGIHYGVLSEGWHWYNSILWEREIHKATKIQASTFGVLIRQYGQPLPDGEILATPLDLDTVSESDTRGIVEEVLKPGKYNVNPYAYQCQVFPVFEVPAGHVGIVVDKVSKDQRNFEYLSSKGLKGIQAEVKEPGTYYLNPYLYDVISYNIRVQKTDFSGPNALSFMSDDSFQVRLTATIEWRVSKQKAALVHTRIGSLADVEKKVISPFARSYVRLIGSSSLAKDYISGASRQSIQGQLFEMLREKSAKLGIEISSVLIRKIIPPIVLREIISARGLEIEKRGKYRKDIEKVKSDAQVAKRREEIKKSQAEVEEDISRQKLMTKVKGEREIFLKNVNKRLAISKLNLEVAKVEKLTLVEKGKATVVKMFNVKKAEVDELREKIQGFGGGEDFANYIFNKRIRIESVLTDDDSSLGQYLGRFGIAGGAK